MHQYRLQTSRQGSNPVEKDLGFIMAARLNMRQQCARTVKQANAHCGFFRGKVLITASVLLCSPVEEKCQQTGAEGP